VQIILGYSELHQGDYLETTKLHMNLLLVRILTDLKLYWK
jgi:hypothetical protein